MLTGHFFHVPLAMLLGPVVLGCVGDAADVQRPTQPGQPDPGFLSDLSAAAVEAPNQVRLDSLLVMEIGVHNDGARTAGPGWFIRVFLSADSVIRGDDILIDQFVATRELESGSDDRYLRTMKLPGRIEPGTYYLGSVLDVTQVVPESDEDNNALLSPPSITILPKTSEPSGDE